ncbi:ATP-binding protein [Streptomyces alanosinicus]|uniref:Tetratricopeptide repeat protein n=1 Tax=Streptomyces alanosinicus TaxID=68171 RepID=A0A918YP61_9ACTN|nr:tetratricopeptide repeat protein [Streptomyces alanosinicus]GHE09814.1 hypothetical protein GCM10010339_63390 [Streptomyces alanosinicus]
MSDHIDFRGGQFHGPVIGKVEYRHRAPAPTALDALPLAEAGFVGRDEELAKLLAALDPSGSEARRAVLVAAVSGLGGIGKTALAVKAAHLARRAGWFPGGALFVDLHGYDDAPVTPEQALQSLLRALGADPEHIPGPADARAALFRSLLAERDGLLILADNASSAEQVRPLLPGDTPRHRILVTSRHRITQLGARLVPLGELTPEESYRLLDRALSNADPDDRRVTGEAEAVARLARLCGHLPLALQITAALLAGDPGRPVADLADELAGAHDRLAPLDDGERSVRAAFELSYRRLPADPARLLRLLSVAPAFELSEEAAAALAGTEGTTPPEVHVLARAHLLERAGRPGRWRMHDLTRAFGMGVVAADADLREEAAAAREQLLGFYCRRAGAADDWIRRLPGDSEPESFADHAEALDWLEAERPALVAAVQWAGEDRFADLAGVLAQSLSVYLYERRSYDDGITVIGAAREAAFRTGNPLGAAVASEHLGNFLTAVGRPDDAIEVLTAARDLYQLLGGDDREPGVWVELGFALVAAGRPEEGILALRRALGMFQAAGKRNGEAQVWNRMGTALFALGRKEESVDAHRRAFELFEATGDRENSGVALHLLGMALLELERVEEAIEALVTAAEVFDERKSRYRLGKVLTLLGRVFEVANALEEAHVCYAEACDAFNLAGAYDEGHEAITKAYEVLALADELDEKPG